MSLIFQSISDVVSESEEYFLESYFGEHYSSIFYNETGMPKYFYYKDFTWIDIWALDKESLEFHRTLEHIDQTNKRMKDWQLQNDYRSIFSIIEKKACFLVFQRYYDLIPKEQRYDIFRKIYTKVEYHFDKLEPDFLKDIFAERPLSEDHKSDMQGLRDQADNDGYLTIYRGECSKSSPLETAWSWTLSYDIAYFFATRFSNHGIIYQTKISYRDVYDYLPYRENEVLVDPMSVKNYSKKIVFHY